MGLCLHPQVQAPSTHWVQNTQVPGYLIPGHLGNGIQAQGYLGVRPPGYGVPTHRDSVGLGDKGARPPWCRAT